MNSVAQAHPLPTTIGDYLLQLRQALSGADPAMIQDALYDAEDYLRSELAGQKGKSEAEVIAGVASSYGAPEEVAEIYRETEVTVARALRLPAPPKRASWIGTFFGVAADPRTYGALFYILLSLLTGGVLFHLGRDRRQPVDRDVDPDPRRAAAGVVLWLGAGVVAGGRPLGRNAAWHAHAAVPATPRPARWLAAAYRRDVHRCAYLEHDTLFSADAAAGHCLFHRVLHAAVVGLGRFTDRGAVRQHRCADLGCRGHHQRLADAAVVRGGRAVVVRHAASGARVRQAARHVRLVKGGEAAA